MISRPQWTAHIDMQQRFKITVKIKNEIGIMGQKLQSLLETFGLVAGCFREEKRAGYPPDQRDIALGIVRQLVLETRSKFCRYPSIMPVEIFVVKAVKTASHGLGIPLAEPNWISRRNNHNLLQNLPRLVQSQQPLDQPGGDQIARGLIGMKPCLDIGFRFTPPCAEMMADEEPGGPGTRFGQGMSGYSVGGHQRQ
jgi:hypothetical protein